MNSLIIHNKVSYVITMIEVFENILSSYIQQFKAKTNRSALQVGRLCRT